MRMPGEGPDSQSQRRPTSPASSTPPFQGPQSSEFSPPGESPVLPIIQVAQGYVADYWVELHSDLEHDDQGLEMPFLRLHLSPDLNSLPTGDEYILLRYGPLVDRAEAGLPNAIRRQISLGNVEQAIIATVKDAALHDKRLTVVWRDEIGFLGDPPTGRKIISRVQLSR